MTDLGTGEATSINDVVQIVGNSRGAFVISGGTRTTLPGLSSSGGGGFSSAAGINNHHQIAEASDTDGGYPHALMWSNGTITELGTLGGTQSTASAINDNGQTPPAAPTTGARSTRSCSHPASDRVQDLPPARLIHTGRSGRLRGARDCSHHLAERTDTGGGPP
jgi:probable HAF family extracellular repeat protein